MVSVIVPHAYPLFNTFVACLELPIAAAHYVNVLYKSDIESPSSLVRCVIMGNPGILIGISDSICIHLFSMVLPRVFSWHFLFKQLL